MKRSIRKNNPAFHFLLQFWQKHCRLEKGHVDWAKQHIYILDKVRKEETLYLDGDKQKNVYFVARGLLARVHDDTETGKRQLWSIALPGMALMTTKHLYSHTPSSGDIIVLRPGTLVIQIPYWAILEFKEQEPQLNTLIGILTNKKYKQMTALSIILRETDLYTRYVAFADDMPELHRVLTHGETAEITGISLSSAQRYYKHWLNI